MLIIGHWGKEYKIKINYFFLVLKRKFEARENQMKKKIGNQIQWQKSTFFETFVKNMVIIYQAIFGKNHKSQVNIK